MPAAEIASNFPQNLVFLLSRVRSSRFRSFFHRAPSGVEFFGDTRALPIGLPRGKQSTPAPPRRQQPRRFFLLEL